MMFSHRFFSSSSATSLLEQQVREAALAKGLRFTDKAVKFCAAYCETQQYSDIGAGVDAFFKEATEKLEALTPEALINDLTEKAGIRSMRKLSRYLEPVTYTSRSDHMQRYYRINDICDYIGLTPTMKEQRDAFSRLCCDALRLLIARIRERTEEFLQTGTAEQILDALDANFQGDRLKRYIATRGNLDDQYKVLDTLDIDPHTSAERRAYKELLNSAVTMIEDRIRKRTDEICLHGKPEDMIARINTWPEIFREKMMMFSDAFDCDLKAAYFEITKRLDIFPTTTEQRDGLLCLGLDTLAVLRKREKDFRYQVGPEELLIGLEHANHLKSDESKLEFLELIATSEKPSNNSGFRDLALFLGVPMRTDQQVEALKALCRETAEILRERIKPQNTD